jgi:hypothetical protein
LSPQNVENIEDGEVINNVAIKKKKDVGIIELLLARVQRLQS